MPAKTSVRRTLAVLAALPLLTLAACGYGSESKDTGTAKVAAGAKKIDGLDSVKIGYFGNLTHGTALVGVNKGFFQKELGATKASYATFNAGPSEIEALFKRLKQPNLKLRELRAAHTSALPPPLRV